MKLNKTTTKATCAVSVIIALVVTMYSNDLRTTEVGLELIGNAEGCHRQAYYCPARVLTVGIGNTTNTDNQIIKNKKYSDQEIAARWATDIKQAEKCVNQFGNGKNMPQGAFEAMTSITFNVGCGAMKKSTLFKMANNGYTPEMCDQFPRWVYAAGKKQNGLVKRRNQERELCLRN